jgi:hypothetical protein
MAYSGTYMDKRSISVRSLCVVPGHPSTLERSFDHANGTTSCMLISMHTQ